MILSISISRDATNCEIGSNIVKNATNVTNVTNVMNVMNVMNATGSSAEPVSSSNPTQS